MLISSVQVRALGNATEPFFWDDGSDPDVFWLVILETVRRGINQGEESWLTYKF